MGADNNARSVSGPVVDKEKVNSLLCSDYYRNGDEKDIEPRKTPFNKSPGSLLQQVKDPRGTG